MIECSTCGKHVEIVFDENNPYAFGVQYNDEPEMGVHMDCANKEWLEIQERANIAYD